MHAYTHHATSDCSFRVCQAKKHDHWLVSGTSCPVRGANNVEHPSDVLVVHGRREGPEPPHEWPHTLLHWSLSQQELSTVHECSHSWTSDLWVVVLQRSRHKKGEAH